jgi:ubiquitin-protein ligase
LTSVYGGPEADNVLKWSGVIFGGDDPDWEDGIFKLSLNFPENYPHAPPDVRFTTPILHPNVYKSGATCLDILQRKCKRLRPDESIQIGFTFAAIGILPGVCVAGERTGSSVLDGL